jgi:hypothetical protein
MRPPTCFRRGASRVPQQLCAESITDLLGTEFKLPFDHSHGRGKSRGYRLASDRAPALLVCAHRALPARVMPSRVSQSP